MPGGGHRMCCCGSGVECETFCGNGIGSLIVTISGLQMCSGWTYTCGFGNPPCTYVYTPLFVPNGTFVVRPSQTCPTGQVEPSAAACCFWTNTFNRTVPLFCPCQLPFNLCCEKTDSAGYISVTASINSLKVYATGVHQLQLTNGSGCTPPPQMLGYPSIGSSSAGTLTINIPSGEMQNWCNGSYVATYTGRPFPVRALNCFTPASGGGCGALPSLVLQNDNVDCTITIQRGP